MHVSHPLSPLKRQGAPASPSLWTEEGYLRWIGVLKDLTVKNKVTVFISTHVLEEIKNYANSATFIDKGEILWSGKVKNNDIVAKHNKLFGLV